MDGTRWRRLLFRTLAGALAGLWIAAPSFAESPASEILSIQKIEVSATPAGSRLAVEGSKSFEYTVFRLTDPLRVVIDLPQAQLGKLAGPLEVRDGTINVIRSRQVDDPQKKGARIEVGLEQMVEYDVNSEGNVLYLNFGKPAGSLKAEGKQVPIQEGGTVRAGKKESPGSLSARKARVLKGVEISASPESVKIGVKGDGRMPDYKSFQLSRPARLVLDLPRMSNGSGKRNIDVGSRWLKDIRIGQHPDKLRLVFTFPESKFPPYQLTREGLDVILSLGETRKETLAEAKTEAVQPAPEDSSEAKEGASPAEEKMAVQEEKAPAVEMKSAETGNAPVGNYRGTRISLDFKDADIHNIFRLIAEVSSLNIITTEDVKGKITIRLVNVPWDQALDVILATKNLIKIEEGNVLRITTIETLRKEREDKQKEEENLVKNRDTKLKLEDPGTKIIRLSYADCTDIQRLLLGAMPPGVALPPGMTAASMRRILTPQGMVNADKRTNTLIIQDVRSNLEEVEQLIRQLDYPTPQVVIEARVVQATTTFSRSLGIQWGGGYNQTGGGRWAWGLTGNDPTAAAGWGFNPSTPSNIIMPSNFVVNFPASTANTPVGGAAISFGKLTGNLVNLDLRLQMGETDSIVKVIARPKLATLTNREALIKQGEKIPYETTSQAGTQVQFIDAVLQLKVTPLVTPDNSILMKVLVTRDARGNFRSPVNQVPSIDNREASTEVLVKDGETLVIGGIYETDTEETTQGIPWLMKIPVLGWLFKNNEKILTKKELLIFITPTILQKAQV